MSELIAQPEPLAEACPLCGGQLLIAPHDASVPTYPTCSDVIPVPERWCSACHLSWVGQAGALVRTSTALAQARHEHRRLRQEREHLYRVAEAARQLCLSITFVNLYPTSRKWQANGTDNTLPKLEEATEAWVVWARGRQQEGGKP